jgi:hypothetical protein
MGANFVKRLYLLFAVLSVIVPLAIAQDSSMPGMKQQPAPTQQGPEAEHPGHDMQAMPGMNHAAAEQPEHVMSGTNLEPASTPAPIWMKQFGSWMVMAHGNVFLTGNFQGGPRGLHRFESMNWLMLMEHRKLGAGTLEFHQMLSAEPGTLPAGGSPQLFQTGESYKGQPLVDKQHPHDLFGELTAQYTLPLNERVTWSIYGGPVGEPALGPVAFMHRASAAEIPTAPLSHHLQDSTHISYGVITTGLMIGKFKIEGSAFNGREPDENRFTFDFAPLDSWAARVSFAPGRNWAAQYSFGRLIHPEQLEAGNINRQTASLSYNRPFTKGNWATTLIWGQNDKRLEKTTQQSVLAESVLNFMERNYAYTRLELVDKDELQGALIPPGRSFKIGAYTLGGVRDLLHNPKIDLGVGADVTFYSKPAVLDPAYGEHPVSTKVFLRIRPGTMKH